MDGHRCLLIKARTCSIVVRSDNCVDQGSVGEARRKTFRLPRCEVYDIQLSILALSWMSADTSSLIIGAQFDAKLTAEGNVTPVVQLCKWQRRLHEIDPPSQLADDVDENVPNDANTVGNKYQ
ncbi:hypothetical protein TNCV_863601 [Trichonephila clavipes]|nr:hypothetical protein TNCV_863601 [Trichonephila clavipes]